MTEPFADALERPYTGAVEIRIHGVSGTPPEDLLDRSAVQQVAGDRVAGFYRPAVPQQQRDIAPSSGPAAAPGSAPEPAPGGGTAGGPWLEGYSWGGWTSGARSRALWLVLMPFALANVALRMLPPPPDSTDSTPDTRSAGAASRTSSPPDASSPSGTSSPPAASSPLVASPAPAPRPPGATALGTRALGAMFRLLAVSLTATMVLGAAIVSVVTVGGRCAPSGGDGCHGMPGLVTGILDRLAPAGRLGLMALVPLLLVVVLWAVSRRADRYQPADGAAHVGAASGTRPEDDPMPLRRADLWRQAVAVRRLRLLHVQAGVGTCAGTLAWVLPGGTLRNWGLWVTAAGLVLVALAVCARPPTPAGGAARAMWPPRLLWLSVVAGVGLDAAAVIASARGVALSTAPPPALDPAVLTVRADMLVRGLFVGQGCLLVVMLACVAVLRLRGYGAGARMFMGGFGAPLLAVLAWLLGSMLTASVLILVPAWLAEPGFGMTPGRLAAVLQAHPDWFGDTSRSTGIGMSVGIVVIVVLLAQVAVRWWWRARRGGGPADWAALRRDYPDRVPPGTGRPRGLRARQIGTMFWVARRVDGVPRGIVAFCVVVGLLLAAQLTAWVMRRTGSGSPTTDAVLGTLPAGCAGACTALRFTLAWGVFLTAALLVAMVALGVAAYRSRAVRRGVGVLWDLSCFWPRTVHPFAPPCYNERIVPEVTARLAWYAGPASGDPHGGGHSDGDRPGPAPVGRGPGERGTVVIAGHSQGSVISVAVVLLTAPQAACRVGLVTFGCVLDRLYARLYPRYFSPGVFAAVAEHLRGPDGRARWLNLWRQSDYLGGAVPYPAVAGGYPPVVPPAGAVLQSPVPRDGPRQVRFVDPPFDVQPGTVLYPVAGRHSGFWLVPDYQRAIDALLADPGHWSEPAPATGRVVPVGVP